MRYFMGKVCVVGLSREGVDGYQFWVLGFMVRGSRLGLMQRVLAMGFRV